MTIQEIQTAALAEHQAWVRELEAERVTHSNETHAELVRRLRRERVESPAERRDRLWAELRLS